jgi:hypothetical protein
MPKTCCAVGCSNNNMMLKKLSFHKFPKDENKCALWLTALKKNNPGGTVWMPTKNSVLCGAHFISGNLIILMKVILSELVLHLQTDLKEINTVTHMITDVQPV